MANLKEIRNRIYSISSTMKITNAMKLVSASKLKKSIFILNNSINYNKEINKILSNIILDKILINKITHSKNILIIISSNKGLCGSFNNNILKKADKLLSKNKYQNIITIGNKAFNKFKNNKNFIKDYSIIIDNLNIDNCINLYNHIKSINNNLTIDILYNKFITSSNIITKLAQINYNSYKYIRSINYLYLPDDMDINNKIQELYNISSLYMYIANSIASENASRMIAMSKATDNAKNLNKKLQTEYNKERQAVITNEILEIISGSI